MGEADLVLKGVVTVTVVYVFLLVSCVVYNLHTLWSSDFGPFPSVPGLWSPKFGEYNTEYCVEEKLVLNNKNSMRSLLNKIVFN